MLKPFGLFDEWHEKNMAVDDGSGWKKRTKMGLGVLTTDQ